MSNAFLRDVYITAAGAFLPGQPINNEQMETRLGLVGGQQSRYRRRVLKANGIEGRHYAIDEAGRQTHLNEELAAEAVRAAVARRGIDLESVQMLSLGTTLGDTLMPGFASMVHGRLGGAPMECVSASGVCASGMTAFRAAYNAVRTGDHEVAVAGASELASAMMRGSRFEKESELAPERSETDASFQYFNADFLRWMLSDGAGAVVLEGQPARSGLSLRVEWVTNTSYAHKYETCMYLGTSRPSGPRVGATYLSYPDISQAERDGLLLVRQDTKLLEQGIMDIVPAEIQKLISRGKLDPGGVDWFMPHLSSYFFFTRLLRYLEPFGITEDKWFTNLKHKGNTGSASIYIMLEEALNSGMLKPGQRVLTMVPESGRFTVSYGLFTVVDGAAAELAAE
ncbi:MAG: 3-oxoacyl-ACP synthase [Polyangiaceae bacterium]|nr:3-oxoacyl-ACP synthase [Polyangiaceae bacterium]